MQAAQVIPGRFCRDHFHFLFKGRVFVYIHCNQAAGLFLHDTDFCKIHGEQSSHILAMVTQCFPDCLQVDDIAVQL